MIDWEKVLLRTAKWLDRSCESYIDVANSYILVFCPNSIVDENAINEFIIKYQITDIAIIYPECKKDIFESITINCKQKRIIVSMKRMIQLVKLYNASNICSNIKFIGTNADEINGRKILEGLEKYICKLVLN